jgi:hypothetical protein
MTHPQDTPAMASICSAPGCNRDIYVKGYCRSHYERSPAIMERRRNYARQWSRSPRGRATKRLQQQKRMTVPEYRIKYLAKKEVELAIRRGDLLRRPCERCGKRGYAHHDSYEYDRWLDVRWLCQAHHMEWHMTHNPTMPDHFAALDKCS